MIIEEIRERREEWFDGAKLIAKPSQTNQFQLHQTLQQRLTRVKLQS